MQIFISKNLDFAFTKLKHFLDRTPTKVSTIRQKNRRKKTFLIVKKHFLDEVSTFCDFLIIKFNLIPSAQLKSPPPAVTPKCSFSSQTS